MQKKPDTNQLFVSGMAQDSTEAEIKEFFNSRFGSIDDVKILKTAKSRSRFFLVTVADEETYQSILDAQSMVFRDRRLHCKPFVEQRSLLRSQIEADNNRRVILKGVPSVIPESRIKESLEEMVGDIEMIFPYKSDVSYIAQFHKSRKFRTYSVLFRNKASAETLVSLGNITLDKHLSHHIEIEKYDYRRGSGANIRERGSSSLMQYQNRPSTWRKVRSTERSIFSGLQRSSPIRVFEQVSGSSLSKKKEKVSKLPNVIDGSLKFQRVDINANMHSIKPTSKDYYLANKKFLARPNFDIEYRLLVKRL